MRAGVNVRGSNRRRRTASLHSGQVTSNPEAIRALGPRSDRFRVCRQSGSQRRQARYSPFRADAHSIHRERHVTAQAAASRHSSFSVLQD